MPVFGSGSSARNVVARARRAARAARAGDNGAQAIARPERWDPTQTSALYGWCMQNGVETRPQYLWPLLHAAHVARALKLPKIAALEFGVAGGNGLLALERAAAAATSRSMPISTVIRARTSSAD